MPHHGHEEEHSAPGQEPIEIRDNRKIDPATGKVRGSGHPEAPAHEEVRPVDEAHDSGDALAQAEQILNEASAGTQEQNLAEELRNDLLRLQAEYVNYRKRVERDRAVAGELAVIGVLNTLLPVLDDIEAARQHGDLAEGPFAAIATKLETALAGLGLERIGETGVEFDPNIHEALMQQPSAEVSTDTVQQVLRQGYKSGDRILRAAQVIVAVPE
ncbi:nucleotide exchange factor GrpE [Arthrobacter mobilis]|uniref:Protein GrpE n=1 Tax=Arthrobacter mobilis TaxID=2724944 RepID=A0A7X6HFL1_9MICC|nr:nucleotide exchange factor GrpE [Arthrobacter mobilis]NKX55248.1 nucleotide exchange factor GrpE [Arthrobacter mobilis]